MYINCRGNRTLSVIANMHGKMTENELKKGDADTQGDRRSQRRSVVVTVTVTVFSRLLAAKLPSGTMVIPGSAADDIVAATVGMEMGGCCDGEGCAKDCWTTVELGVVGAGVESIDFACCTDDCCEDDGKEMIRGTSVELAAAVVEDCFDTNGAGPGCPAPLASVEVG